MKKSELKKLIKEELINEVTKSQLLRDLKNARKFAGDNKIQNEFLDEVEKNIGNWGWLKGIDLALGSIILHVGTRLSVNDMNDIVPLMEKYRMNLDGPSKYSRNDLKGYLILRLFYTY